MKQHFGGTLLGLVLGFTAGLAVALAVAVFISKVPVPFLNKDPAQQPLSEAAEARKNLGWNPNAPLAGRNPARAASAIAEEAPNNAAAASAGAAPGTRARPMAALAPAAKPGADPIAEIAKARSSTTPADPFIYFVQAGAFRNAEDADAQKAKLSLLGIESKISEREQAGRAVFRVRSGPFERHEDADKVRERLEGASFDAVLVRVQR
jgi:cell division protein FtsN